MKKRSIVYIDGFNLFYGALKGTTNKWLNLEKLFYMLRKDDNIIDIKYFTALVTGHKKDNQEKYLLALETLPKVTTILGRFKMTSIRCTNSLCDFTGDRHFNKPEEKRTDVNIAVHMVSDALQNKCDRIILVSGDSDLVPSLNMIKLNFPEKEIIVYIPARNAVRGAAVELRSSADKNKTLPNNLLSKSQLPNPVINGDGIKIEKPESW